MSYGMIKGQTSLTTITRQVLMFPPARSVDPDVPFQVPLSCNELIESLQHPLPV